ncbi:MAG TPA: trimethylamine methyltransferase family protein [Candidatus Hydrogenedentes bacterium]|nr:trimethylamine methyltransferase family protein [Candidatus Hydrogenedentota bacterium]
MDFSRVLSDDQIARVQAAAESLLEETGVKIQDGDLLRCCAKAGAKINETSGIVQWPKTLLRELIARAPASYTIGGLLGDTWEVGGVRPWSLAIVTDPWIIDYATQQPRRPCLEDLRRHTIIAQQMDPVAAISRMDFPVTDVEGPASSLRALEMHLLYATKHYYFPSASPESNRQWLDLMRIVADGKDPSAMRLFSVMVAMISPLVLSSVNTDLLRLAIEYDAPVVPTICPMAGSTSPYTRASTLVLGHAENLALAALTQLLKPGHPFLYTFGPSVTDLRSGQDLYYTLDKVLWKIASVQLARSLNLPVSAECGGTMTYRYDQQNGMEGFLFMLAAAASGANLLAGFGSCYDAVGMSAEMMVIQEAWLQAAQHLRQGIPTDALRLGLGNLYDAGPGGEFLTDSLTLEFMHGGEFFSSDLFDYTPAEHTGKSLLERAHERVEALTENFTSPVPGAIQEALRRYFHDVCTNISKHG